MNSLPESPGRGLFWRGRRNNAMDPCAVRFDDRTMPGVSNVHLLWGRLRGQTPFWVSDHGRRPWPDIAGETAGWSTMPADL